MRSILSLFVHCRIPISVKENNTISTCQINSNATTSCTTYKAKNLWGQIKSVDHLLARFHFNWTVKSNVCVAMQIQELFQNV
jgi:hypothetical protein